MESNVEPEDRRTFNSPAEAAALVDFGLEDLREQLDKAHRIIYDEDSSRGRRLEMTFRTVDPARYESVHRYTDHDWSGEWMQYQCDFTNMWAAVRRGAPIPQVLLFEDSQAGEGLLETYLVHPDFLEDRSAFFEMLSSRFQQIVQASLYDAIQALDVLRYLSDLDELPGLPTEGVSYPQGRGYEALGKHRPVEGLDDTDE